MPSKPSKKHNFNKNRLKNRRITSRRAAVPHLTPFQQTVVPKPPRNGYFIWGRHAVFAAIQNHDRRIAQIYATNDDDKSALDTHVSNLAPERRKTLPTTQRIDSRQLEDIGGLIDKAVHQGVMAAVWPLDPPHLDDFLDMFLKASTRLLLLDQLSDPRNIGAIIRSAHAFGAAAVITTIRNAAGESGTLARTASGGLDHVPYIRVPNLTRAIKRLQRDGFTVVGLTSDGNMQVTDLSQFKRLAIVLGSEGGGLRRLSRKNCDHLVSINIDSNSNSLNVSNAAAVALYAASLQNLG